jgi:hypothetical protein
MDYALLASIAGRVQQPTLKSRQQPFARELIARPQAVSHDGDARVPEGLALRPDIAVASHQRGLSDEVDQVLLVHHGA